MVQQKYTFGKPDPLKIYAKEKARILKKSMKYYQLLFEFAEK